MNDFTGRRGHEGPVAEWGNVAPLYFHEEDLPMYSTPTVERFGTLRELTQAGKSDPGWDISVGIGEDADQPSGCTANASPNSAAGCVGSRS